MLAEIEKIKSLSVSSDEVQKAVKQFISATLATRKTMEGQANDLGGSWLAANNLTFSERYLAAVKRVTHADVQRVAREYLTRGKPHALRPVAQRHDAETSPRRWKRTLIRRSRNLTCPTACACL